MTEGITSQVHIGRYKHGDKGGMDQSLYFTRLFVGRSSLWWRWSFVAMKSFIAVIVCLSGVACAVDMSRYSTGTGVEVEFEAFLKELYATAEDQYASFNFIDFFQPPEQLIVLDHSAYGTREILALKESLLPPGGNKHWNHLPTVTTVHSQSPLRKVYQVHGIIESVYEGGNCSIAYYTTLFPVKKDENGMVRLTPHKKTLLAYDDFFLEPSYTPTEIPCEM